MSAITVSDLIAKQREMIASKSGSKSILNIVEFATSKSLGLGLNLYPMQIFIFKVFYKIPLTDDPIDNLIVIRDTYNEEVLHEFTEIEMFRFLVREKRINLTEEEYLNVDLIEILFFLGRRASKTLMVSVIFTYTAYLLIKMKNPHKFFGVSPTDPISFTAVSNNEEGGVRQYNSLKSLLTTAKFFKPYLRGSSPQGYWLATPRFIQLEQSNAELSARGDLNFIGSAATQKVRGSASIVVALDEYAHFPDSSVVNKAKPRDLAIYEAITPSVAGFVDTKGKGMGKTFIMTSPNGKRGDSYKKYENSFKSKDVLMLNMPSHWVNNRLSSQHLRKMYMESVASAEQEYGAKFIEGVGNFIRNIIRFVASINTSYRNTFSNANKLGAYYLSVDLAQSGDGIGFAISHKESVRPKHTFRENVGNEVIDYDKYIAYNDIVSVDFYSQIVPEKGGTIHHKVIIELFVQIYRAFNIVACTIDQWSHQVYAELLSEVIPIDTMQIFTATQASNSLVGKCFNRVLGEGRLMLPETVLTDGTKEEFEALVETVGKEGMIKVQAPSGGHDDRYSAISRAIFMAEEGSNSQQLLASTGVEGSIGSSGNSKGGLTATITEDGRSLGDVLKEVNINQVQVKKFEFKNKG